MNDTPRKDHLIKHAPIGLRPIPAFDQAVELVDALERELNSANERIKRLEEAGDAMVETTTTPAAEAWNKARGEAKP
jgi:hypothetical protein